MGMLMMTLFIVSGAFTRLLGRALSRLLSVFDFRNGCHRERNACQSGNRDLGDLKRFEEVLDGNRNATDRFRLLRLGQAPRS